MIHKHDHMKNSTTFKWEKENPYEKSSNSDG